MVPFKEILNAIEESLQMELQQMDSPGIWSSELKEVSLSEGDLKRICEALEREGFVCSDFQAEIALYIRIGNDDVCKCLDRDVYSIKLQTLGHDRVVANITSKKDWFKAWERGIAPLKTPALESIKEDIRRQDSGLGESDPLYRVLMVLLASEMVGPYVDHIASFTGYPKTFVETIGARLSAAKIWDGHTVDSEGWFDEKRGRIVLVCHLLVAQGRLARRWSQEENAYTYIYLEEGEHHGPP